jgi:hypothetical protein
MGSAMQGNTTQQPTDKGTPDAGKKIGRIPLALFTYNRPAHTRRTLEYLTRCSRREDYDFYFFLDAPRKATEKRAVVEVRAILSEFQPSFNAKIIEQQTNQGLSRSIAGGVDRLCEAYGCVVVLEDDLLVGPGFLGFMADALKEYEDSEIIMQIAGTTLAPPDQLGTDAFLLPITSTWGWATWKRAWKHFSWTPEGWPESKTDKEWMDLFTAGGGPNYIQMLEDRLAGRNDSWGILWWYAVSRARGYVVYPKQSLVWNGGFDGSGVHCGSEDPGFQSNRDVIWTREWQDARPSFPEPDSARQSDYDLLRRLLSGGGSTKRRGTKSSRFNLKRWLKN